MKNKNICSWSKWEVGWAEMKSSSSHISFLFVFFPLYLQDLTGPMCAVVDDPSGVLTLWGF